MSFKTPRNGFTFVEILMTLAVVAILFVPVSQLFSHSMYATTNSLDMLTANQLASSEMERLINLNLTKDKLKEIGDVYTPPIGQEPLVINKTKWRVQREVIQASDPLEVRIHVYREEDLNKPVVTLVTLIEDMMWGSVKQVSA